MAPFAPAEGVLTLERDGIVALQRFRLEKRVDVVKVRLDRAWVPGVFASVRLVGATERENDAGEPDPTLPRRPAFANGEASLELPPRERELNIAISPKPAALEPGGTTSIAIDVKDAAGSRGSPARPWRSSSWTKPCSRSPATRSRIPWTFSMRGATAACSAFETHDLVVLGKPDLSRLQLESDREGERYEAARERSAPVTADSAGSTSEAAEPSPMPAPSAPAPVSRASGKKSKAAATSEEAFEGQSPSTPIAMRTNFNALAAFVPRLVTDARGHAEARVKLPDNLTRYRVMAVAAANQNQFGSAESDVTARLPLMVRPSAPRFLNFGDRAELPVVLQNQTAEPMTVDVALRVDNLKLFDPNGRRVVVPAADRVELRFPIGCRACRARRALKSERADERRRRARDHTDAAEIELPVWTPATTEAFATYGVVDQGAVAQPVRMPSRVVKEFGGLDITTSSTALQGLSDAVLYIVRYPFDCNEQIASRLLTIAALRDVLTAFSAEGLPKPEVLEKTVALDVQKLADRQSWSGGWDYWRKDRECRSLRHGPRGACARAREGEGLQGARRRFCSRRSRTCLSIRHRFPSFWPPEARRAVEAYALDVRRRAGDADPARARALVREAGGVEKMPLEALGWLLTAVRKGRGERRRASRRPAASRQSRHRNGGQGALRDELRRRRPPLAALRSPCRRHLARCLLRRSTRERRDSENRRGPARRSQARPLVQHAGKRVHPARARSLLPGGREGDSRFRRARLARQRVCRRARLSRQNERSKRSRDSARDGRLDCRSRPASR